LFEITYLKLSEFPEKQKANFNMTDLIMKSAGAEKVEVKTYVAVGIDVKPTVEEKGIQALVIEPDYS
jgi:hypothetical protein